MVADAMAISNVKLEDFKCQMEELQRYCVNLKTLTEGLDVRHDHNKGGCIISLDKAMAIMYGAEALEEYAHKTEEFFLDIIKED